MIQKKRINNDVFVRWGVFTPEGLPVDLTEVTSITIEARPQSSNGRYPMVSEVVDNFVEAYFLAKDQKVVGKYNLYLTYTINDPNIIGGVATYTIDYCDAFELLPKSCFVDGEDDIDPVNIQGIISSFTYSMLTEEEKNDLASRLSDNSGAQNLSDLLDVTISNLEIDQILKYDGTKWVNAAPTGGSSSNVSWGIPTSQYTPLTVNGVTRNLSLNNHTHHWDTITNRPLTDEQFQDLLEIADLWKLDNDGNLYTERNVYSHGEVSAYNWGESPTPPVGVYNLKDLLDVGIINPQEDNILRFNGSHWVNVPSSNVGTLVEWSSETDNYVNLLVGDSSKSISLHGHKHEIEDINNLQGSLNFKQDSIPLGDISQYYRGNKEWATLNTDAVVESTNLYYTPERVIGLTGGLYAQKDHTHAFGSLTGLPNTLDGYGIIDAYNKTEIDNLISSTSGFWVKSVGLEVPTGFTVSNSPIIYGGNIKLSFDSGYSLPSNSKQYNWDLAFSDRHTHTNIGVLNELTIDDVSNWNSIQEHLNDYNNPHQVSFKQLINKPSTLLGYGITDVYNKSEVDYIFSNITPGESTIKNVYGYDSIDQSFSNDILTDTFNAYTISMLHGRLTILEQGGTNQGDTNLDTIINWYNNIGRYWLLDVNNDALYTTKNVYSTKEVSAYGLGTGGGGGGSDYERLDAWADYDSSKSGWVLSAFLGNDLNTRVIAIDSRVTDLENSAGSGSVTSVGISVPTGLSVSNSPITSSGVIAIGLQTGYSIPTTVKQGQWDTAYGWGNHSSAGYALASSLSNYVPTSRTLTINGTSQNLSANRTWNVGTVTSVAMTTPTGLTVTGSPITSSGTLALSLQSGYSIPTTAKINNWDEVRTWWESVGQHLKRDATNQALYTDDNFYSTKEVSAYGVGSGGGSGGAGALSELSDTSVASRVSGDILVYNGTHWENRPQSSIVPDLTGYALETWVSSNFSPIGHTHNYIPLSQKGTAGGVAELDASGRVLSSQLPSYVDDVLSYVNQSIFPTIGEVGKIYIAEDTNKTYRWAGGYYVEISPSIALGETSATAYRGDRGKIAYDHALTEHQTIINGIGFVKANGKTLSYDNSSYSLSNHNHSGVYEPVFTKNTAFNKNFGTAAGTVAQGNDSRIINGQTAYNWGDHSSAGYALAIRNITAGNGLTGGGNLTANRTLTLGTPSDITATSTNSVTLTSHTHSLSMGSGSGLDADLLDGKHGSDYRGAITLPYIYDYDQIVIGLVNLDNSNISRESWSSGQIYVNRVNGVGWMGGVINYSVQKVYNASTMYGYLDSSRTGIQLCTFTYNGVKYGGIRYYPSPSQLYGGTKLYGRWSDTTPFVVRYRNNSGVLNSEVDSSIVINGSDVLEQRLRTSANIYAFTSDNVASATKLETARTIWGQSFDGTANVSGNISNTGNITPSTTASSNIGASSLMYERAYLRNIDTQSGYVLRFNVGGSEYMRINTSGDVGIGTTSPSQKLHVAGNILATGEITAYVASDRRLKENIKPIPSALDYINRLNPVTYNWNARAKELNSNKPNSLDYGLIAQEVEKVLPNIVHGIFDDKYKSIDYIKLIPIMIGAIKELKQEINRLKN